MFSRGLGEALARDDVVALVAAHLEDISKYFLPTVNALKEFLLSPSSQIYVVSCTTSLHDCKDKEVNTATVDAFAGSLGIPSANIISLDSTMYKDGQRTSWDIFALVHQLKKIVITSHINWMVTFDFEGVCEDVTHRKTWRAVRDLYTFEGTALMKHGFKGAFQLVSPYAPFRNLSLCGVIFNAIRNLTIQVPRDVSFWIFRLSIFQSIRCFFASQSPSRWTRAFAASASTCLLFNEYKRIPVDTECL